MEEPTISTTNEKRMAEEPLKTLTVQVHDLVSIDERNALVNKIASEQGLSAGQLRLDIMDMANTLGIDVQG